MRMPHLLVAAALLAVACTRPAAAQRETAPESAAPGDWSYAGPTGPAFWRNIAPGYPDCGSNYRQSPVNVLGHPPLVPFEVSYPARAGTLSNSGHGVDLLVPVLVDSGSLTVGGATFQFREVHFHIPAEHTINGFRYEAEIHTVHQQGTGNRAVLTTFVMEGQQPNPAWSTVIDSLPGNKGDRRVIGDVNLNALLSLPVQGSERMYGYDGSLTTPPCTPNVRFLLRQTPIRLSRAQLNALSTAMVRNIRPLQQNTQPVAGLTP
jgi:carbonic anhydrase